MRTGCVQHPENHPLIVIRKWQVEFCDGDLAAAALMSYFEYWHNIKLATQPKAKHQNNTAEQHGEERTQDESLWQWHTADEIEAGVMVYKRDKIRAGIKVLEEKKVIEVGSNPNARYKFDRTKFFLFNPAVVNAWLRVNYPSAENRNSETENRNSPAINPPPPAENQQAITETTTKITSKTTIEEKSSNGAPAPAAPADLKALPVIVAFKDLYGRYPTHAQMKIIVERNPPVADWVRAIRAWAAKGHRPVNIEGMLDWAFEPSRIEEHAGGKARVKPADDRRSYSHGIEAFIANQPTFDDDELNEE
jgi:hypothetical protein